MAKLSDLFDGWVHYLEPEKDFLEANHRISHIDAAEEEEELTGFESPSPDPVYVDASVWESNMPYAVLQQSWASLSMALGSLSAIVGGGRKAYQHNSYDNKGNLLPPQFTFQFEPGEDGFQEGRL